MKSKLPENSPNTHLSKKAVRRAALDRAEQQNRIIKVVGIGGVLAVLIALVIFNITGNQSNKAIEGVESFSDLKRDHTTELVTYPLDPPVGGEHNSGWQNCGAYSETIANEYAVHSLEHGAVWITYQPDLSTDEVDKLKKLTRQSGYRLLSPYPDLPSPIVISAWGYQLQLDSADDPRLTNFIEQYELNPASPEPGAPCTGGIGEPG